MEKEVGFKRGRELVVDRDIEGSREVRVYIEILEGGDWDWVKI